MEADQRSAVKEAAPPRVKDIEAFWTEPPPVPSERALWWVKRIESGWVGNRRTQAMGYYEAAHYFGVYIWELLNMLRPALDA